MCFKDIFNINHKKIKNDENVNDLDFIELLLEYNISGNNKKNDFNTHNEMNNFYNLFNIYINDLFQDVDYITIKNDNDDDNDDDNDNNNDNNNDNDNNEEKVYKNEIEKIVQCILEYKIIIRNKSFSDLMRSIKIFNQYERNRVIFIENIKKMDINKIFEKIDKEYVNGYKDNKNKIFINLKNCEIQNSNLYNYLMTFEREKCNIKIESNHIFIYYNYKKNMFKYELENNYDNVYYGEYMGPNSYVRDMFVNPHDRKTYNSGLIKCGGFFINTLDIENNYLENIFKYHHINIFTELEKKYKNYKFNTFMFRHYSDNKYYLVME